MSKPKPEVVHATLADDNNMVVSMRGGTFRACKRPCAECPWRRENDGSFPAEAFRVSAPTAYDLADSTFACHMSGSDYPATCAGALLSTGGEHNLSVRRRIMEELFSWDDVEAAGADLHPNYRSMAEANGVDPDDPVLGPCR